MPIGYSLDLFLDVRGGFAVVGGRAQAQVIQKTIDLTRRIVDMEISVKIVYCLQFAAGIEKTAWTIPFSLTLGEL